MGTPDNDTLTVAALKYEHAVAIERIEAERDEWRTYAVTAAAQSVQRLMVIKLYEKAFDELFAHCASNGIFNAWQKPLDCTSLNLAHEAAGRINVDDAVPGVAQRDQLLAALKLARPLINAWPQCRENELLVVDAAIAAVEQPAVCAAPVESEGGEA